MADAKGEDNAVQRYVALVFDGLKQVVSGFIAPAFAVLELLQTGPKAVFQCEDLRRRFDPTICIELLDLLGAQPFDVKSRARHEMFKPLNRLRGTDQPARAPAHRIALFADRF